MKNIKEYSQQYLKIVCETHNVTPDVVCSNSLKRDAYNARLDFTQFMYNAGFTAHQIAKELKIGSATVYIYFKTLGICVKSYKTENPETQKTQKAHPMNGDLPINYIRVKYTGVNGNNRSNFFDLKLEPPVDTVENTYDHILQEIGVKTVHNVYVECHNVQIVNCPKYGEIKKYAPLIASFMGYVSNGKMILGMNQS